MLPIFKHMDRNLIFLQLDKKSVNLFSLHCVASCIRHDNKVVCITQSTNRDSILNQPLHVTLAWIEVATQTDFQQFTFTYKPDPEISDVELKTTIVRYLSGPLSHHACQII